MSRQAAATLNRCRVSLVLMVLAAALLGAQAPARAQTEADLKLALMVDASGSVDRYRFELQKRGYVAALRNPRVLGAVMGGRTQSIAISMVQWTGPFLQSVVLPWTLIKDEASIKTAAAVIENTPRQLFGGGTSISGAIDYAMTMFARPRSRPSGWSSTFPATAPTMVAARLSAPATRPWRRTSPSTDCRSWRLSLISISTSATT